MWSKISNFFHNYWSRLSTKQKYWLLILCLALIIAPGLIFASNPVLDAVLKILIGIISALVTFFGKLLAVVLHCLIWVAQYNNFINETVVVEGWKVIRDVCNMFFVLGLLIIAFGTVLRLPNYQAKNLLRGFIFGAIFVNFSKTICGLILDFAQIIMLTFVNGFKDVGAGNLTEMLGLTRLFEVVMNDPGATELEGMGIFISYLLALVYLIIAFVVILTMTIMLIQRAVMLWLYIVLSPFPYLLSALPKTGKLSQNGSRWWSDFTGLVITGPMLAFFIWLSFFTASGTGISDKLVGATTTAQIDPTQETTLTNDINAGVTSSGSAQSIIKFLVSIGLLWAGMMMTKEASSLVGGVVGDGMKNLTKMSNWAQKGAKRMATGAVKNTAKWTGRNALKGAGGLTQAIFKNTNSKFGQAAQKIGYAGQVWGQELTEERKKEKTKNRLATLKKLGLGVGDKTMQAFKNVADDDVVQGVGKTVKAMARGLAGVTVGALGAPVLGAMIGAPALVHNPFNKTIGRGLKQRIKEGKIEKNEEAYNDYHKKIANAAGKMNAARQTSQKDYDSGAIDTKEHNRRRKAAINEYNRDKDVAYDELVLHQKRIKEPAADQTTISDQLEKARNTRWDEINKAETTYQTSSKNKEDRRTRQKAIKDANKNYEKAREDLGFKDDRSSGWNRFPAWLAIGTGVKNLGQGIQDYHPFKLSSDAAKSFLKDNSEAKDKVEKLSERTDHDILIKDLGVGDFSGGLAGITPRHKKFYESLTDNSNPVNTTGAINNLIGAVGKADPLYDKEQNLIRSMLRGIAGFEFNGGDVSRLQPLIAALNSKAVQTGGKVDEYKDYLKKSVKMRQVDQSAISGEGSGALKVNSLASGKHNTNIVGVDFDKLTSLGDLEPDLNTGEIVGANIAPEKMADVAKELTGLIDEELETLQQAGATMISEPLDSLEQRISQLRGQRSTALKAGNIDQANADLPELEQISRIRDLRVSKERLADPASLGNLSLKNTGVSLASATQSQTTNLHESLHGFGLDNENLTENVAKQMASGSYKVDDAATVAQNLKSIMAQKNISQDQLSAEDIAQAISGVQPASQVEQVIAKEGGETIVNNINNTSNQTIVGGGGDEKIMETLKEQEDKTGVKDRRNEYLRLQRFQREKNDRRSLGDIKKAINNPTTKQ
jgi:hypothetical protein